jgi:putative ABC transport system permease protein
MPGVSFLLTRTAVAIVNDLFAQQFGEPSAVLGRDLRAGASNPRRIIGVVKGMIYSGDYNRTQIFLPDHTPGRFFVTIVARVNGRAEDHIARVRDAIKSVDPQIPLFAVETMEEHLTDSLARPKFYSTALLLFAAFALLLAVIGIYGVVSYGVAQRTHEIGVRLALGTTPSKLREVLLRQNLITIAAGAIPGIAVAMLGGRYLESLIEGAKSVNLITCGTAVLFIGIVAIAGIWAATRRIARLDVMDILRAA